MRLRWTEEAANDLERIADYLVQNTPGRAQGLIERIYDATGSLLTLPDRGRPGKVKGTRELVLTALPYVVVYVVREDAVVIVRILHGAQQWPLAPRCGGREVLTGEQNGCRLLREGANHSIFVGPTGRTSTVPRHSGRVRNAEVFTDLSGESVVNVGAPPSSLRRPIESRMRAI